MESISINNDDNQYKVLKVNQDKYLKNNDTHKNSLSFPMESVQCEDGGLWRHVVIKEANSSDYGGRYFIIRVMKTGRLIMQNMRHSKCPIFQSSTSGNN